MYKKLLLISLVTLSISAQEVKPFRGLLKFAAGGALGKFLASGGSDHISKARHHEWGLAALLSGTAFALEDWGYSGGGNLGRKIPLAVLVAQGVNTEGFQELLSPLPGSIYYSRTLAEQKTRINYEYDRLFLIRSLQTLVCYQIASTLLDYSWGSLKKWSRRKEAPKKEDQK